MKSIWCALIAALLCAACGASPPPAAKGGETPAASQSPPASPTPVTVPLNLANSTAVIFFHDSANPDQVDGVTWDGVVGLAPAVPDYHAANPSATLFGTPTQILDRRGALVAKGNFGLKSFTARWADDDVHYCLIQPFDFLGANGIPATLEVGSSEGGASAVAQVGKIYEQVNTYVASCSFAGDRATVVQSGGQGVGVAQYWVVQVSTGRVLWTHDFANGMAPMSVVVSHDSRYFAENYAAASGAQTSTIFAADGASLTRFNASVAAFSWDDSTVVLSSPEAPAPAWTATLDGRRVLWSSPPGHGYVWNAVAEPNGVRMAVAIANPTSPGGSASRGYPPVDLYELGADGSVITVLRGVYW